MVPIVKGLCNESVIEKAYNPERKYPTPLAPGLGLVLAKCCFNYYNKSCAPHPPLLWTKSEEAVKQFKETVIIPYIVQKEDEEKIFAKWAESLSERDFDYDKISNVYVNPKQQQQQQQQQLQSMADTIRQNNVYDGNEDSFEGDDAGEDAEDEESESEDQNKG
jgi:regulator of RNase E activity RraB